MALDLAIRQVPVVLDTVCPASLSRWKSLDWLQRDGICLPFLLPLALRTDWGWGCMDESGDKLGHQTLAV